MNESIISVAITIKFSCVRPRYQYKPAIQPQSRYFLNPEGSLMAMTVVLVLVVLVVTVFEKCLRLVNIVLKREVWVAL